MPPTMTSLQRKLQSHLPPLNYITLHYIYFISLTLSTSVIFYCISTPAWSIPYVDCLFLQISAMTEAGLNTYNLSQMNTVQQCMLFVQIVAGSAIFVSISVLHVRRNAFERRFGDTVKQERRYRQSRGLDDVSGSAIGTQQYFPGPGGKIKEQPVEMEQPTKVATATASNDDPSLVSSADHITFASDTSGLHHTRRQKGKSRRNSALSFSGVGAQPVTTSAYRRPGVEETTDSQCAVVRKRSYEVDGTLRHQHILTPDVVGRNSQFHGLTRDEREHIGGVEYRTITLLSWIVPIYFGLFQLLGCLSLGAWMANHARDTTESNGINPWWNGAFNAISAFNNSGMSLLDANMIPFQTSTYPVITMGFLILAGNTAYPVFLRLILWTLWRLTPTKAKYRELRDTLKFALDHPRRVYTNLFPSRPTWWLLMTLIVLNGTDWLLFELLNIGNSIVESLPVGSRVLDGLFQALAVRSGGFYIVPIAQIRIGVQVLYVVMMYISVYPVAMTTRTSNVYEERSLGLYSTDTSEQQTKSETTAYFLRQQVHGQLAHDLPWLVAAIFIVTCVETSSFERDPATYSVFNITFEIVSGYGCVGISTGLPDQAYSFSGGWHKVSKLIICAVMLRGRHRGLPVALDRAVLLPGDKYTLGKKEEEDHILRRGTSHTGEGRLGSSRGRGDEEGGTLRREMNNAIDDKEP